MSTVPEQWALGEWTIPKGRYLDPEFLALENERLFPNVWQMACRQEELPEPGSFYEYTIGRQSILVVRQDDGSLRAMHNSCAHRGMKIIGGSGKVDEFRCRFHGWRYDVDGTSTFRFMEEEFAERPAHCNNLSQVHVDSWGGWVFVHMGDDPPPLLEWLDPLPTLLAPFNLEGMRYAWRKSTIVPSNWKTLVDAFVEGWHSTGTHPQMLRVDEGDPPSARPATVEEFAHGAWSPSIMYRNHSRFIYTPRPFTGVVDPARAERVARPEYFATMMAYQNTHIGSLATARDVRAARSLVDADLDGPVFPAYIQACKELARAEGVESYPNMSMDEYVAGNGDWHVTPTMVFLVEQSCVLGYRMRPNGDDPDSCLWDVFSLEHMREDEVPHTTWEHYPTWRDHDWGQLITQDLKNLGDIQKGMYSHGFDGLWINTKQEGSVINHHRIADRFLFGVDHGEPPPFEM
ncbi:MAG: aromatic ring-hydroxylating dioxygenase subunit alpha [Acidimicrobiales bacterium]|nr:aromatic ring-hydroxylating dioxygenase subunit alpha [Acidimicrobiales bacterium]